jgi:hypothetical protein
LDTAGQGSVSNWIGGTVAFNLLYESNGGGRTDEYWRAVELQGPTIVLLEAIVNGDTYLVGGYNPFSWDRSLMEGGLTNWRVTTNDADRTAFLFNLSSGGVLRQKLTGDAYMPDGYSLQTLSDTPRGPTWGNGDFSLNSRYNWGSTRVEGYGRDLEYAGRNIFGLTGVTEFQVGRMEVYSASVPEPTTLLLVGAGAIGGALTRYRRRKSKA